jgi:hypothetical protein
VTPDPDQTVTAENAAWQTTAEDSTDAPSAVASAQQRAAAIANDRPEVAVGAAFAGGLVLALILKRLAR